jgi:hypothetical protein
MEDLTDWEQLDLSGFPDRALLPQMTEFLNEIYVTTEAGDLYVSSDGQNWTQAAIDKPIKAILGYLPASTVSGRKDVLCCIAEVDDELRFISIDKQLGYTQGQKVPETFPISGFGQFHYETMYYPRLVVATGRDIKNNIIDKAWATMDGLAWASLSNPQQTFMWREGAAVFYYGYRFFVIGGIAYYGLGLNDIYFSVDQGVNWFTERVVRYNEEVDEYESESFYLMPDELARGYTSVIVDKDNYILLFGGKARIDSHNVLNEIWRGRINYMGFGKSR